MPYPVQLDAEFLRGGRRLERRSEISREFPSGFVAMAPTLAYIDDGVYESARCDSQSGWQPHLVNLAEVQLKGVYCQVHMCCSVI